MGPITLFDKSFLQSLSVDESVWFAHFFMPVVCPLFYVETLADLEKAVREGRTPEQEVGIIAAKFPDASAAPCANHAILAVNELLGMHVPMEGIIPRPGGRAVSMGGKTGVIYERSMEEEAFSRWQSGRFLDVERNIAKGWRTTLSQIDLQSIAKGVRAIGYDATTCRTLEEAHAMARKLIEKNSDPYKVFKAIFELLKTPGDYQYEIVKRWSLGGKKPLAQYAPYVTHLLTIELFFQIALAAHLIGAERASNRVDIAYLNYLPFCMMFVSGDDLHRKCAPLFLRGDQQFVWAPDLKHDLACINSHFMTLPDSEKERGITFFAHAPPKREGSLVRSLRAQFMGEKYDDQPLINPPEQGSRNSEELVNEVSKWAEAPSAPSQLAADDDDIEAMTIKRSVRKKRGSWWQLPKDLGSKE
jgi:hypothetical protein